MPHNPYAPPTAPVDGGDEKTAFDFIDGASYSFTPKQLWWAGACCVLSVIFTPIYFYSLFTSESIPVLRDISNVLVYLMTGVAIYVYLIFKKLLREKSKYQAANLAISLYILMSIISSLVALLHNSSNASQIDTLISVGELLLFGSVSIYLGLQLLRCEDPLFGQRKTIAYLTLAMGITLMTVVLALLGIVLSIGLDIVMALMFFRASHALEKAQS